MKETYYEQLSFKELMLRCLEQIVTMYFAILGIGAIVVLILGEINIHQLEEKYPTSNLSGIEIRPIVREMNQNCIKYLLLFEQLSTKQMKELMQKEETKVVKIVSEELPYGISVDGITPSVSTFNISAYCACEKCCGKTDAITASGKKATEWCTVAAGKKYAIGTIIYIPDLADMPNEGWFIVQDRGGAISDEKLDVYMSTHEKALEFGRKHLECYIYEKQE